MHIITDIKNNPRSNPDDLCARFGISRRQFYKDRDDLLELGFDFHFSRRLGKLVLDKQFNILQNKLGLEEIFTLIEGINALALQDNLYSVLGGLTALRNLLPLLPIKYELFFREITENMIMKQTLGCSTEMLDKLQPTIQSGYRLALEMHNQGNAILADPQELTLNNGQLELICSNLPDRIIVRQIANFQQTPFYSP